MRHSMQPVSGLGKGSPKTGPSRRRKRLMELIELVRNGKYSVPSEWVADAILTWPGRAGRRS